MKAGDTLDCGSSGGAPQRLETPPARFGGGALRLMPTPQTRLFPEPERARFGETAFTRDVRGNRQGVRLNTEGPGSPPKGN